jgi:hypothetical protein
MIDKDSATLQNVLPWVSVIILSCWGGAVSHLCKNRSKKFSARDFVVDLLVSSFAGVMMHLLCQWAHMDGKLSAVLIAISGHMGTRAIASFEAFRDRLFLPPKG